MLKTFTFPRCTALSCFKSLYVVVPRQHSSGGKSQLLGITKRGDKQLRRNLIMGARAVTAAAKEKTDEFSLWIKALMERRGFNKAVVAVTSNQ